MSKRVGDYYKMTRYSDVELKDAISKTKKLTEELKSFGEKFYFAQKEMQRFLDTLENFDFNRKACKHSAQYNNFLKNQQDKL